jgi:D-sedoheptulose 7-phosphate isomerase
VLVRERDIVMGFGSDSARDDEMSRVLAHARQCGALTFALPGQDAELSFEPPDADRFVSQELLEILYHTLWETVHVFFEHRERGHEDVGASAFLYPFLGSGKQDTSGIVADVAASIRAKADEDVRLRERVAHEQADAIADVAGAVADRVAAGATLLLFGNGGSATDANDWAIDCVNVVEGRQPVPALSLSTDPACITALANDIGQSAIFLRQLIAQGRPGDVAIGISTSGGSPNIIAALEEARRRGMLTVALLGYDGGEIVRRGLVDLPIVVACDYIPRIQEVQASIYHVLTDVWQRKPA